MTAPSSATAPSRPYWVFAVIAVYLLLVAGILALPWIVYPEDAMRDAPTLFVIITIWLLLLGALMFVPIQIRRQRPITRRSIWLPVMVTGLLAGVLVLSAWMAFWELLDTKAANAEYFILLIAAPAFATWILWSIFFLLLTRKRGTTPVALALHKYLFAGCILELLIAIPCHLVVRRRTECCAGMLTGSAICLGVLVTLLTFGPAIALLYLARWRRLTVPPTPTRDFEVILSPPLAPPTSPRSA